jgi:sugar lactone lactonase YvrE
MENRNNKHKIASLYLYNKGTLIPKIKNIGISNGIAFNKSNNKMYFADSLLNETFIFDYNELNYNLYNKQTIHKFTNKAKTPDGGTFSEDDKYYSSIWGGSCVRIYDTKDTFSLKRIIYTPSRYTTCCCIGGKDMNKLFITSAKEDDLSKDAGKSFIYDLKKSIGIREKPVNY